MNNTYMIFNVSELEQIDFTQVLETSIDTIRKSVDETKTFVNTPVLRSTNIVFSDVATSRATD